MIHVNIVILFPSCFLLSPFCVARFLSFRLTGAVRARSRGAGGGAARLCSRSAQLALAHHSQRPHVHRIGSMRRSQIMAARARQAQAQVTTGASEVHTPDSSLLPPFVHKSQIGSHAHATPATSQCDADAAAVSDDASSSSHALTLPRWNIDITKKNHAREERNARAREETELRRARRAERPGGPPSNNHETRYGDENLDGRHMQAGVDAADDDPPLVPLSSPVLGLSDAKRAFLASAKPGTIHSAAATTHTDDTSAASAASLAGVSTHVPAVLPAFSPSKKRPLFPPPSRGSGVVPRRVGPPATAAAAAANAAEKPERYFHAAFCARTTKKHKNYDDGVLIVCGRRCILKVSERQGGGEQRNGTRSDTRNGDDASHAS